MGKSLVGIILAILANILFIFLFLQIKKIKTNIGKLEDNTSIPAHSHSPNVIDSSGNGQSGLNESEVIRLIEEKIENVPRGGTTIIHESGEDDFRNASATELGYELSLTGDKFIFNKEIEFNQDVNFAWATAPVVFGSSVDLTRSNTRIRGWNNMVAPFFIDFNSGTEISNLEKKFWYLCDGGDVMIKKINGGNAGPRTTPDLRGRFIWGGGKGVNTSLTRVIGGYNDSLGFKGGEGTTKLKVENLPDHNHKYEVWGQGATAQRETTNKAGVAIEPSNDNVSFTTESNSSFEGKSFSNLPPYMVLAYFIYWPPMR